MASGETDPFLNAFGNFLISCLNGTVIGMPMRQQTVQYYVNDSVDSKHTRCTDGNFVDLAIPRNRRFPVIKLSLRGIFFEEMPPSALRSYLKETRQCRDKSKLPGRQTKVSFFRHY